MSHVLGKWKGTLVCFLSLSQTFEPDWFMMTATDVIHARWLISLQISLS